MKRFALLASVCLGLVLGGCSKNEAATEKCKASTECEACCKREGATGHASTNVGSETTCKCLGGN